MKRLMVLSLIAASGAVAGQGGGARTIALSEVEGADAMTFADRLLPAEVRKRVVKGKIARSWAPVHSYRVSYREREAPAEADRCERMVHAFMLSADVRPGSDASPDTPLRIEESASWREAAVLPAGRTATAARCKAARGYVALEAQPERRLAAYRVLVAAMTAAAGSGSLPFRIACEAEEPAACAEPRKALATLPVDALSGVDITCASRDEIVRRIPSGYEWSSCAELRPGSPYEAEIAFGMSGEDGHSWRVSFLHADRWPEVITLERSLIIYH